MNLTLPNTSRARKDYPIGDGCLAYFPSAIAGVARHSYVSGAKHTGGELVHKRYLSADHSNCVERHLMDLRDLYAAKERGVEVIPVWTFNFVSKTEDLIDTPINEVILSEVNALAWRALAISQEAHEKIGGAPIAPAARLAPPPPPPEPPMMFRVEHYPQDRKIAIIKAIRTLEGNSLKEAKDTSEIYDGFFVTNRSTLSNEAARKLLIEAGAALRV